MDHSTDNKVSVSMTTDAFASVTFVTYDDNDYLRDRLIEINEVCNDMESLNEMTRELARLVDQHWVQVDNIQAHIQNANREVREANKDLEAISRLL